jgi:hypothetical protein
MYGTFSKMPEYKKMSRIFPDSFLVVMKAYTKKPLPDCFTKIAQPPSVTVKIRLIRVKEKLKPEHPSS